MHVQRNLRMIADENLRQAEQNNFQSLRNFNEFDRISLSIAATLSTQDPYRGPKEIRSFFSQNN